MYMKEMETCWGVFKDKIRKFLLALEPFQQDIKLIQSRYDYNVAGYFDFIRFLFLLKIYILLAFMYILIYHIINYTPKVNDQFFCMYYIPCSILYSRFSENEKTTFSFSYIALLAILFIFCLSKWIKFRHHSTLNKLFDKGDQKYVMSKSLFNSWDFSVNSKEAMNDHRLKFKNLMILGIHERKIKSLVKKRTCERKVKIYLIRFLSFVFTLFILGMVVVIMVMAYILAAYLSTLTESGSIQECVRFDRV